MCVCGEIKTTYAGRNSAHMNEAVLLPNSVQAHSGDPSSVGYMQSWQDMQGWCVKRICETWRIFCGQVVNPHRANGDYSTRQIIGCRCSNQWMYSESNFRMRMRCSRAGRSRCRIAVQIQMSYSRDEASRTRTRTSASGRSRSRSR